MTENEQLASLLRNRDLKVTPKRLEVLSLISEGDHAISYTELQTKLESFDRVTLYRIINVLLEKGIVHKARSDQDETYFAMCAAACTEHAHHHAHVHFTCTRCEEVSCVEMQDFKLDLNQYLIREIEIQASGLCQKCAS